MANCSQCGRRLPPFTFGRKICQWCKQHETAQQGEVVEDARQQVMPVPWVRREATITLTHIIFGANLAVFLAMALATGSVLDFPGQVLVRWANFGPLTLSGQWWRLLTYMFLHGGLMHIAFNMWCLWDLGALCESLYGRWTYGVVYLLTGIAGGIASTAWNPGVFSVGASGAIFGLAGALLASFHLGEFSLPRVAIRGVLRSLVFFIGFNVFFGALVPGIDNACHVGGLVSGMILGALIARVAPEHERPLRRAGVLLLVALLVGGAALGTQRWRGGYLAQFGQSNLHAIDNVNRMITELQQKVRHNPQDASAHYALAHAYFVKGEFSEGVTELKRVLELQPQDTAAQMELGEAYLRLGDATEAQSAFNKVLSHEPDNASAHTGLGIALAEMQDHRSAIAEYKKALQLDPEARGVYHQMGLSQAQLNQYDDAIASYQKERDKHGDSSALETALAEAYQSKGMTQQAQDARDKAAQLRGNEPD